MFIMAIILWGWSGIVNIIKTPPPRGVLTNSLPRSSLVAGIWQDTSVIIPHEHVSGENETNIQSTLDNTR